MVGAPILQQGVRMLALTKKQQLLIATGLLLCTLPLVADSLYMVALEVWCAAYGIFY